MWNKHGVKRPERLLVTTTHCEICLVQFRTGTRLLAHLREKFEMCRLAYWRLGPRLDMVQADELDALEAVANRADARAGLRRGVEKLRCQRLLGPLLAIVAPLMQANGTVTAGRNLHQ